MVTALMYDIVIRNRSRGKGMGAGLVTVRLPPFMRKQPTLGHEADQAMAYAAAR